MRQERHEEGRQRNTGRLRGLAGIKRGASLYNCQGMCTRTFTVPSRSANSLPGRTSGRDPKVHLQRADELHDGSALPGCTAMCGLRSTLRSSLPTTQCQPGQPTSVVMEKNPPAAMTTMGSTSSCTTATACTQDGIELKLGRGGWRWQKAEVMQEHRALGSAHAAWLLLGPGEAHAAHAGPSAAATCSHGVPALSGGAAPPLAPTVNPPYSPAPHPACTWNRHAWR